jgi:hypothetical protein
MDEALTHSAASSINTLAPDCFTRFLPNPPEPGNRHGICTGIAINQGTR